MIGVPAFLHLNASPPPPPPFHLIPLNIPSFLSFIRYCLLYFTKTSLSASLPLSVSALSFLIPLASVSPSSIVCTYLPCLSTSTNVSIVYFSFKVSVITVISLLTRLCIVFIRVPDIFLIPSNCLLHPIWQRCSHILHCRNQSSTPPFPISALYRLSILAWSIWFLCFSSFALPSPNLSLLIKQLP